MEFTEKTVKENVVYAGKIITVRRDDAVLHTGKPCVREVVCHSGGVCVGALTKENELLFVRQFRYPYMETILELPAGKLEQGEDPFLAGVRELEEETGHVAASYMDLGKLYPSPGYCGEIIHLYAARDLTFTKQHLDQDEFLSVERIPLEKACQMVLDNEIRDAKTQTIILKMAQLMQKGIWREMEAKA